MKGTTSVRTLESLYWFGVRLLLGGIEYKTKVFHVTQWEPYEWLDELEENDLPTAPEALRAILKWNDGCKGTIHGHTRLLIVPGYPFQMYVNRSKKRVDMNRDVFRMSMFFIDL